MKDKRRKQNPSLMEKVHFCDRERQHKTQSKLKEWNEGSCKPNRRYDLIEQDLS